jgi:parallel beta-helix repeat protein
MRKLKVLSTFLFVVLVSGLCPARVICVDADASGGNDGTNWTNAFNYLQDALIAAAAGDEIRVAGGIYYPDLSSANPVWMGNRQVSFALKSGVAVLGGYAGVGEPDPNERDMSIYETVLSGDLAGNDVWIGDVHSLWDDTTHDENSYCVVVADNTNTLTILDGFTISGGNADSYDYGYRGGAILITGGGLTVSRCRMVGNLGGDGGAIGCFGNGSTVISNCFIGGNWASDCGGGAYVKSGSVEFRNCVFSGNSAEDWGGGGVFQSEGNSRFINCTFSGNWASDGGSGVYIVGGSAEFVSCIVYEQISMYAATADFRYCNVPEGVPGEGNIHTDPNFVDADGIDNIFGTADDGLMLKADSPCIDAGDPNRVLLEGETDLADRQRIANNRIDIGAYEFGDCSSLAAHWKLDETAGAVARDSAGDSDGELIGWVSWHPEEGRIDGAAGFDGVGEFINCGKNSAFDIRDRITVCAWIKVEQFTRQWQAIVTKGDSAWRLQGAGNQSYPGALEFACSGLDVPGTTWGNVVGTIRVDDGRWHHAAGVYDGSRISLYVDGILDVSSTATGQISVNDYDVLIGENAERTDRFWKGMIDDVRVYNHALTPQQIVELANPPATYHVDTRNGDDLNDGLSRATAFKTIQAAISQEKTVDGDTILVWPGVYNEEVYFWGKAITVRSAADAAVIEVQMPAGYAFTFHFNEGPGSVLSNFVIRNSPGAVFCNWARPTIRNLTVVNNGIGIEVYGGMNPDISNCIFWNNRYGNIASETGDCPGRYCWDWMPPKATAHWRMDDGQGGTMLDSVGSSNGTLYGNAHYAPGQMAGALELDGDGDYVIIPNNPAISVGRGSYAISAWIRPVRVDDIRVVLGKMTGATDKEYLIYIDKGRLRLDVENQNNNGRTYSVPVVKAGVWQHVGVVFNRSSLTAVFYHNGVPVATGDTQYPITLPPDVFSANLWIGMRSDMSYEERAFAGRIDNLMIFNRVISAEEMTAVYNSGLDVGFGDATSNDFHLRSEKGRYVPLDPTVNGGIEGLWTFDDTTSICIDAGDPQIDPLGEKLPNGGRLNQGAYGGTACASMSEWPLKGDLNHDGAVDLLDIAVMAGDWLRVLPWAAGR